MSLSRVSSDELEDMGFDKNEIALIQTADMVPDELNSEDGYFVHPGVAVFDGKRLIVTD